MATSPRDVKLGLSVETTGQEQIKKLQASIAALAKEGGDAAPEFQALADEIGRLGDQQGAIGAFRELSDQLQVLTERQDETAAAAVAQAQRLTEASRAADNARAAQERASETQQKATAAYKSANDALVLQRAAFDSTGARMADHKAKVLELTEAKIKERTELDKANKAYSEAKTKADDLARAQAALEKAYARSNTAAERAAAAARAQSEVVAQAAQSAEALGVSTSNLATAQVQLAARFAQVEAEAQSLTGQLRIMEQAEQEAAQATKAATVAAEEQAAALKQVDAARVATETRALADTERLLAAEFQFAAETAQRLVAAQNDAAEAAARLKREQSDETTRKLAVAQGFLSTELQLVADAAERAAADQRRLDAAQEETAQSARRASAAAAEAGQRIEAVFGTVGVRSAEKLKAEIDEVRSAMATLAAHSRATGASLTGAFTAGEAKIKALERDLRELNGQLTLGDRAAKLFSNSLGQIAAGNIIADGVGALVEKVKELGRAFITVITQTESMRRGLTAIYGSATTAAEQIEFLRSTSLKAGVSMSGIADSFVRFSAATQQSNIPLKVTNDLFSAVTRAGSTLGLSSERVTLVLDALGQMASKGVVSMEELRQQLGDSLPGALSIAARGLGLTEQELIKLVESGQLAARDLFPGMTEGLKSLQADSDTLVGSWGRLKTAFSTLAESIGDGGGMVLLGGAVKALTAAVGILGGTLLGIVNVLAVVGSAVTATLASIFTLSNQFGFLGEQIDAAVARQAKFSDAIDAAIEPTKDQAEALNLAAAAANAGSSSSLALAAAQTQAAISGGKLEGTALGIARANVQYQLSSAEASKAAEVNVQVSERLAKAKQLEGEANLQAARISGNAVTIMTAQTEAARANVGAAEEVLAARRAEAALTETAIARTQALGAANGGLDETQKALVASLTQKLTQQEAAVEKSEQERRGLEAATEAARIAALVYADNSASLETYNRALQLSTEQLPALKAELAAANAELDRQALLLRQGLGDQEAVNNAQAAAVAARQALTAETKRAAEAERLYNDALADSVRNIELKARAEAAGLQITLANVNAAQKHAEVMVGVARAQGDETQATYYAIEAKNRQIDAIRLTTQIKQLEAQATIQSLEVQKQEIALNDPLRAQKLQELEIRIQLQKAKLAEAGASSEVIRGIEAEIAAIRNGNAARSSSTSSVDENTASRYKNVEAIRAQAAAEKTTSDGFKANADGSAAGSFNSMIPIADAQAIIEKMRNKDLSTGDLAQAKLAVQQARNAQSWLNEASQHSAALISPQASRDVEGLVRNSEDALARVELLQRKEARAGTTEQAPAGGATSAGTVSVNISLGGRRSTVSVASQADANALTGILRELENASGTSA